MFSFVLFSFSIHAQELSEDVEELMIEQLLETVEGEVDLSELTDRLRHLLKHPLDLNTASEQDLATLFFLNPIQIANIIAHRTRSGRIISPLELQGVDSFDSQTIQRLLPFVTVAASSPLDEFSWRRLWDQADQEMMLRYGRVLELSKGYKIEDPTRSQYLGDPTRLAMRYRMNYKNTIRLSINMDKDAGEPFFKAKQKYGFDFYSASLAIKFKSKLKYVVLGDYALQFGQGLSMWNGLSFGKGAWIGSMAKQGGGLRPYTSLNESNFLRGLAGSFEFGGFQFTPFFSMNKLSGKVSTTDSLRRIVSISHSGLHRTPNEMRNRDAVNQLVYGANAQYRVSRLKVGFTAFQTYYDGIITPPDLARNRFAFRGQALTNLSGYYQFTLKNTFVFGEVAQSLGSGLATVNGLVTSLSPKLSFVASHRYYQKDYHQFFGQGLGEGSNVNNEQGLYTGIVFHPSRSIEWVNYVDMFKFPGIRYRADGATDGYDVFSQFSYTWYKKGKLSLRFRHRSHQENTNKSTLEVPILADVKRYQLRGEFQMKLSERWTIRSRVEGTRYQKDFAASEWGILVYQDVLWNDRNKRVNANMRLAYFNTDGYNSRIYAYENDVLYASSFPMYYHSGVRVYTNFRVRITRSLDLWARYGATFYKDLNPIGTGLDEITGNRKSDVKIQTRLKF